VHRFDPFQRGAFDDYARRWVVTVRSLSLACWLVACARPPVHEEGVPTMKLPTGAWQRDWIQRDGGARDDRVAVRYVQTPSVFGDLRIPADRPALAHAAGFADLRDDELAALAAQNGFAGVTTINEVHATWHHQIDFQPSGGGADVGRLEPRGPGRMLEHGEGGSYVESWSALEPDTGAYIAVETAHDGRVDQLLAVAGSYFVYARARPGALPAAASIRDAIAGTQATRDMIIGYLDCEISFGTVRGWQIERSTLPWQEGKRLAFVVQIAVDAEGRLSPRMPVDPDAWSFPVNTFGAAALRALFVTR
jgi:hypothetical protein